MTLKLVIPKPPKKKSDICCQGVEVYLDGERQYRITEVSPRIERYFVSKKDNIVTFEGDFKIIETYGNVNSLANRILTTADDEIGVWENDRR